MMELVKDALAIVGLVCIVISVATFGWAAIVSRMDGPYKNEIRD